MTRILTAGALGLRLGGPRLYDGEADDAPWLGDGRRTATARDIRTAIKLIVATFGLASLLILAVWMSLPR